MRQLLPQEMEFIADLADAQINGTLIVAPNGDTRYDDASQQDFNEVYDQVEHYYREVTTMLEYKLKLSDDALEEMTKEFKQLKQDFDEYQAWVKEESEATHLKALHGVFGEYTCSHCHRLTHDALEVEHGSELVCEECYNEDYVRCERCDTKTIDYHVVYGDMHVCDVCKDDM